MCSCGPVRRASSRSFSFWTTEVRRVKSPEMFQTRRAEMREACKLTGQYACQGSCIRLLTLLRHSNLHWQGFWGCPVATSFYRRGRRQKLEWEDGMPEGPESTANSTLDGNARTSPEPHICSCFSRQSVVGTWRCRGIRHPSGPQIRPSLRLKT